MLMHILNKKQLRQNIKKQQLKQLKIKPKN